MLKRTFKYNTSLFVGASLFTLFGPDYAENNRHNKGAVVEVLIKINGLRPS